MASRQIVSKLEIDWDFDGFYTDESDYLISYKVTRRLAGIGKPLQQSSGIINQAVIEVSNNSNRFSSKITTGALYSDVANGGMYHAPIKISGSVNGGSGYTLLFVGVLKIPFETTLTPSTPKNLSLTAYSKDELLRNYRFSIPQGQLQNYLGSVPTDSEVITYLLDDIYGLDPSDYSVASGTFSFLPYTLAGASILEYIWAIANASGGFFYCAKDGKLIYENYTSWLTKASAETITRKYSGLALQYSEPDLTSKAYVSGVLLEQAATDTIYQARSTFSIPSDDSKTIEISYSAAVYLITGINYKADANGSIDLSADVSYTITNYVDRSEIVFTNANTSYAATIRNLTVYGKTLSTDSIIASATSADSFWTDRGGANAVQTRISNNLLQNEIIIQTVADLIISRAELPIAKYQILGLPVSLSRELGDRITVDDDENILDTADMFITDISIAFSAQAGFKMDLACVDGSIFPYLDSYFILDTSTLTTGTDKVYI